MLFVHLASIGPNCFQVRVRKSIMPRDRVIAADWAAFHRTHAMLEVVLPEENLQAGKGG
jgi:hypothetical protein